MFQLTLKLLLEAEIAWRGGFISFLGGSNGNSVFKHIIPETGFVYFHVYSDSS